MKALFMILIYLTDLLKTKLSTWRFGKIELLTNNIMAMFNCDFNWLTSDSLIRRTIIMVWSETLIPTNWPRWFFNEIERDRHTVVIWNRACVTKSWNTHDAGRAWVRANKLMHCEMLQMPDFKSRLFACPLTSTCFNL